MNIKNLLLIELIGRILVSITSMFVVVNLLGKWYAIPTSILMVLWVLNPLFEYKTYGGN